MSNTSQRTLDSMSIKTLQLGHPKARHNIVNKSIISVQGMKFYAHTLEDAAKVQLFLQALEGKGPISKLLKDEAKKLTEKFSKANPDFEFAVIGRKCGSKNKEKSPMKKNDKGLMKEPKKSSKPKKETPKKLPTKKAREAMDELAVAS